MKGTFGSNKGDDWKYKLEEIDYEPRTVQIEVNEGQDRKVTVCLHDSSSRFMEEDCSSTGDDNVEWGWNVSDNQEDGGEDESDNSIQEQMTAEVANMQARNGQLVISFAGKIIKMDVPEQLLLLEGVCRKLVIVFYHLLLSPRDTLKHATNRTSTCAQCVCLPATVTEAPPWS